MSFPSLERCDHGEYRDRECLKCQLQEATDALRQWATAERTRDDEELQNARAARDRALEKANR